MNKTEILIKSEDTLRMYSDHIANIPTKIAVEKINKKLFTFRLKDVV